MYTAAFQGCLLLLQDDASDTFPSGYLSAAVQGSVQPKGHQTSAGTDTASAPADSADATHNAALVAQAGGGADSTMPGLSSNASPKTPATTNLPALQASANGTVCVQPSDPSQALTADASTAPPPTADILYQKHLADFSTLAGGDNAAVLKQFLSAVLKHERQRSQESAAQLEPPDPIVLQMENADKAQRTAVHAFFRRPGLPKLQTDSMTASGNNARGMLTHYCTARAAGL